jgi:uncharacterized protein YbaP (TraB family)
MIFKSILLVLSLIFTISSNAKTTNLCENFKLVDKGFYNKLNPRKPEFEKSLLWKITSTEEGSEKVSFIMGTMHSDNKVIVNKMKLALPLLARVDGLISEAEYKPSENLNDILLSDVTVTEKIDSTFSDLYSSILKKHNLSLENYNRLKVWYNFSLLSRPKVSKFTLEKVFLDEALTVRSYLGGLETNKSIVSNVESMGEFAQLTVLIFLNASRFSTIKTANRAKISQTEFPMN